MSTIIDTIDALDYSVNLIIENSQMIGCDLETTGLNPFDSTIR